MSRNCLIMVSEGHHLTVVAAGAGAQTDEKTIGPLTREKSKRETQAVHQ